MKALIKKYPINAKKVEQNEVYIEPQWQDWIDENGEPLTDENYGYALCDDCPADVELTVEDFEVKEFAKEVVDEYGEVQTVKYWTAVYIGGEE